MQGGRKDFQISIVLVIIVVYIDNDIGAGAEVEVINVFCFLQQIFNVQKKTMLFQFQLYFLAIQNFHCFTGKSIFGLLDLV